MDEEIEKLAEEGRRILEARQQAAIELRQQEFEQLVAECDLPKALKPYATMVRGLTLRIDAPGFQPFILRYTRSVGKLVFVFGRIIEDDAREESDLRVLLATARRK